LKPFWVHSGLALLDVDDYGGLQPTDDFLRAYLARPELAPIDESGPLERALHRRLLDAPRQPIEERDVERIEDSDARDSYRLFLRFRDRLLQAPSLQAAYVRIFADALDAGRIDLPPLFVDQLAQIIVQHILVDCEDGLTLRAAELWFREQRVSVDAGRVVLADADTLEARQSDPGLGALGRLLAQGNVLPRDVDLDVLDRSNAERYFGRDEAHDFALEITYGRPGAQALADIVRRWVGHLLGVKTTVTPLERIDDSRWRWHVGLDAQASVLLDALYRGEGLEPEQHRRLLLLMRLDFSDLSDQVPAVAGKPVYLAVAMDEQQRLRLKPQNLLFNLPLARPLPGAMS